MNVIAKVFGPLALALTLVPALLFATKSLGDAAMKGLLLAATFLWFAAAPFWLKGGDK